MALPDPEKPSPVLGSAAPSPTSESVNDSHFLYHSDKTEETLTPQVSGIPAGRQLSRGAASVITTDTTDPDFEIDWEDENDPSNPRNWPIWYKALTLGFISWSTFV